MSEIQQQIRDKARELLKDKKVDLIIGYAEGSLPIRTRPIFLNKEESCDKLVWNSYCQANLAKFLPYLDKKLKIGVVSKGCVGRTIVHLAIENQIIRENIIIIGLECKGNVNRKKIEKSVNNKEILEATEGESDIKIKGRDFENTVLKEEYLNGLCKTCTVKATPVSDIFIGEKPSDPIKEDTFDDLKDFDSKTPDEKWAILTDLLSTCIRCYSCRESCPMCYCNQCFVDQIKPVWFDKTTEISDIMLFHMIRAFHVAGRCTSCGDCTNACPMGIDLTLITRELAKIVKERFDFKSGLDLETPIPFGSFKYDDKEDFMIKE